MSLPTAYVANAISCSMSSNTSNTSNSTISNSTVSHGTVGHTSVSNSASVSHGMSSNGMSMNHLTDQNIKQRFLTMQMKKRITEFTERLPLRVFCGTFNVNAREFDPLTTSLSTWLFPSREYADIYAVGLQEMVSLNGRNVVMDNTQSNARSQYWVEQIGSCLNEVTSSSTTTASASASESSSESSSGYTFVMEKHVVGICLIIFVKSTLFPQLRDVRVTSLNLGILGIMGNKGAIAIRFRFFESSLCFVCAHLQANRNALLLRNSNIRNIIDKLQFVSSIDNEVKYHQIMQERQHLPIPRRWSYDEYFDTLSLFDHDYIYWLGDLNYRIDEEVPIDRIFMWCMSNHWEILRDMDQLNIERKKGSILNGFHEGILTFPPTYKFQPGTQNYDQRNEKKIRAPAWCDRILYYVHSPTDSIVQLTYQSAPYILFSDHRPVSGEFEMMVRIPNCDLERTVYQEQLHVLDKMDNDMTPIVAIEGLVTNFGSIQPLVPFTRTIKIINTGVVLASWQLMPKPDEVDICAPWITFNPKRGILAPMESMIVEITVEFNATSAIEIIQSGRQDIDELVILAIDGGRHFFCTVQAHLEEEGLTLLRRQSIAVASAAESAHAEGEQDVDGYAELSFDNIYNS